jgi:hypothetical protein
MAQAPSPFGAVRSASTMVYRKARLFDRRYDRGVPSRGGGLRYLSCTGRNNTRHMPTPSSIGVFAMPIASISPAKASDVDGSRSIRKDRPPARNYAKNLLPAGRPPARRYLSYRRATPSRNQRATSSESAVLRRVQRIQDKPSGRALVLGCPEVADEILRLGLRLAGYGGSQSRQRLFVDES